MLARRFRMAVAALAGLAAVLVVSATPSAAEVTSGADASGDVADATLDVVGVTAENGSSLLTVGITVARGLEPSTSPAWTNGDRWFEIATSTDGDDQVDVQSIVNWNPQIGQLQISSFRRDGTGCERGFASFDGRSTYTALVPQTCLGPGPTARVTVRTFERSGPVDDAPAMRPLSRSATTGNGFWMVARDGGIFTWGEAGYYGSTGDLRLNQPVVGMAPTASGLGYWLVAADGGIFSFGDAAFLGSTGNIRLNQPIVGMAATPTGRGYWLVARDGGIFTFGDAAYLGSTGDIRLAQPIVGMAATRSGQGYWMVAADGGIFTFGDAPFLGSAAAATRPAPIVGMTPLPTDRGYRLVGADGSLYVFGDATHEGSPRPRNPVVGITNGPRDGRGYWMADAAAGSWSYYLGTGPGERPVNAPVVGIARTP